MPHSWTRGATGMPVKAPLQMYAKGFLGCIHLSDTDTENWAHLRQNPKCCPQWSWDTLAASPQVPYNFMYNNVPQSSEKTNT